jgi:hypothetical protein
MACTDLAGMAPSRLWYRLYLDSVDVLAQHLHQGVSYWEYTVKSQSQVERMLTELIARLDSNEIRPRRPSSGPLIV